MKVLVTAGSTNVMIDQVRCISNIFKGRTGNTIAQYLFIDNKEVTLLTSDNHYQCPGMKIINFKTYDELYSLMEKEITTGNYDVVIHSAAVSDYKVEGTYTSRAGVYHADMQKVDSSTKISSDNKELYLKLVPTEKIIDKIRDPWGFKGKLVKFKLQVGISDEELLDIATKSCATSKADFIVANCLEWSNQRAYIIRASNGEIASVNRDALAFRLADIVKE
jgi:phosphopantothenate---cysteine ligase (CTP)